MSRVTIQQLRNLVTRLNEITGNPTETWKKDEKGRCVANIGNYHLSGAYGGWSLEQICSEGGGVNTPLYTGYVSKKELYNAIHTYMRGIELGKEIK